MKQLLQQYRNKKILLLCVRIDKLKEQKKELIKEVQEACKHEHTIRCEYIKWFSGNCSPPYLMCLNCGQEADEWHWDRKGIDKDSAITVKNDEFYSYRY